MPSSAASSLVVRPRSSAMPKALPDHDALDRPVRDRGENPMQRGRPTRLGRAGSINYSAGALALA